MSKKVMIINGSPRKGGNTATVSHWIAEGLQDAGVSVEFVDAARLNYKTYGCTSCLGCQQSDEFRCIIKDDASEILARMPDQDAVIFATPVYFMGFSAQIKLIIDRMFSLVKIVGKDDISHALQKPELVLLATAGGDEGSGLNLVKNNMASIAGFLGKPIKQFSVPFAPVLGDDIINNQELHEKARSFGFQLLSQ